MKINSRKLLLLLFSTEQEVELRASWEQLQYLLPDFSPEGLRSTIYYLVHQQWLIKEGSGRASLLSLSNYGKAKVAELYPFLEKGSKDSFIAAPQSQGYFLIFLNSPLRDPQFRALRKVVVNGGGLSINKGVYFFPIEVPPKVKLLCTEKYLHAVLVFSVKNWFIGDPQVFLQLQQGYGDVFSSLSGVSKEVERLIEKKLLFSSLNHQAKFQIFSVYERFFHLAEKNGAVLSSNSAIAAQAKKVLLGLQNLIFSEK